MMLISALQKNRHAIPLRCACAGLALSLSCMAPAQVAAQPAGIPSMGAASSAELSPALERTLGDAIMEQGRRDPTYISDPDVNQYLTSLGRKLVANAPGGTSQQITVFGVRDPQINAFALPGGYIGVHSGLLVAAGSESELAGVVAHEIGHVLQRHIARGMTQQSQSNHVLIASLAAALLAALSGSGDLAMGVAAFGQAAAVDQQLGFSRQAEQEADRVGLAMMSKAGFDPQGMVRMFQRLGNASRLNEGRGGSVYTSTHPLSIQRLSDIENRLAEAPRVRHQDSDTFWYVRAKLRVMQAEGGLAQGSAIDALRMETQGQSGVQQAAAWYGLAYAAWRKRDIEGADQALRKAQAGGREAPELASLAVEIALARGNIQEALSMVNAAWRKWPSSQGLALKRAEVMQKAGGDKDMVDFLNTLIRKWPDMATLYKLRAQAQERLNMQVEARRSMAQYYEMTGALPTAVEQLRQARDMSKDFYVKSELDVQIRNLKQRLEDDRALLERFKS
ncbi:M48 family metalloprotease [Allopusillimonas soli]|nr:M48 family metalloprotease [Allopusillimonas soli]